MKIEGIKSKREFKEVLEKGQKISSSFFLTYLKKTDKASQIRAGFIITKKIGNAVVRNKIKRKIKEALRNTKFDYEDGITAVFIIRKAILGKSYLSIIEELKKVLRYIK